MPPLPQLRPSRLIPRQLTSPHMLLPLPRPAWVIVERKQTALLSGTPLEHMAPVFNVRLNDNPLLVFLVRCVRRKNAVVNVQSRRRMSTGCVGQSIDLPVNWPVCPLKMEGAFGILAGWWSCGSVAHWRVLRG